MNRETPPGWHPDPYARHAHRYWDGTAWTDKVSDGPDVGIDAPTSSVPTVKRATHKIVGDVQRAGAAAASGGGTLFTEPILVVNQKAKLLELTNEYAVYDQNGTQLGAVRQVGQSAARKVLRALTKVDQFLTTRLEIVDMTGRAVLSLTRPAKLIKSRVIVSDASGAEIGQIVQQNAIGKIRFGLVSADQTLGSINAENWRAWNFSVRDHANEEVARITKTWEGLAKTMFTTADNYVLQILRPLQEPLRSLVVAGALAVDTALKQDARGLGA
jgi:uncharacterized protein YxjI